MKKIKEDLGKPQRLIVDKEAMQLLVDYPFGGNIRELENVITNLHVFCEAEATVDDIPRRLSQKSSRNAASWDWRNTEKDLIERALEYHNGNQSKACRALGYGSINTLRKKIADYDI